MRHPRDRRIADTLVAHLFGFVVFVAFVFGAAMSFIKGNGGGVRDSIGNVSAPWLLLPFFAGALAGARNIGRGARIGTIALLAALGGFYLVNTKVLDLGPHSWLADLRLTVQGGQRYFALAVLGGPIFGALGGWWRRDRSTLVGVLVAALPVFEPVAWLIYGRARGIHFENHPAVWAFEVIIGMGAGILVWARRPAHLARPARPARPA
jgi:Family of unknown function (DUF6518)